MDKLTAIKIKYDDGTYSDEIPVSVLSENVEWDSTHTLVDVLGSIDVDVTGTIQDQISQLFNEKVSSIQLQNYVASQLNTDVTNWLNTNVNPVGSAVVVDSSLTISGAAADAKVVGNLKSAFSAFYKDSEVFTTEIAYSASTYLPQTAVYNGIIPSGTKYTVEATTTGGVSRIDIKLGERQTYNTPSANKVKRSETASTEINMIQISIPANNISSNGTITVVVRIESPFDKKIDKDQGSGNLGKTLVVNSSGELELSDDLIDLGALIQDNVNDIRITANDEYPITIWRSISSGGFNDNGEKITSNLYYRQSYACSFPYNKIGFRILKKGIKVRVFFFSATSPSSESFISKSKWNEEDFYVDVPERNISRPNVFTFVMIGKTDGTSISYNDAVFSVKYYLPSSIKRVPITNYEESLSLVNGYAYYNTNYRLSHFINVNENDVLKTVGVHTAVFYSAIGDYIQALNAQSGSITVPAGASLMVIVVKTGITAFVGSEEEINNIYYISKSRITDDDDKVPSVFFENDYLPNKITSIRNNSSVEKGMSFAFVTDMHVNDNSLVSGKLLKYILKNTTIPFIICGGDIPTAYATEYGAEEAECESEAQRWIEYVQSFGWNMFYAVRGNHDFMKPSPQESTQKIYYVAPEHKTYNYISRNNEHVVKRYPPNNYYYIDNISERIRIIVLDEYKNGTYGTQQLLTQEQVDWVLSEALNVSNYHLLFVSHSPFDSNWTNYNPAFVPMQNLFKAIKNKQTIAYSSGGININADFSGTTNEFIAHLCGHTHLDNYNVDDGVLTISTTCDAFYKKYEHNRIEGTITEPALDIVSIDIGEKAIKMCRIGEGADREIVYADAAEHTITQNLTNCISCYQTTEAVYDGSSWINFYHPNTGYSINAENVSITMGGVDITNTVWNQNNKRISISQIIDDIVITISAT